MRTRCFSIGVAEEGEAPELAGRVSGFAPPRTDGEVVFPLRLAAPMTAEPAADDEGRRAERGCGPDAGVDATGDESRVSSLLGTCARFSASALFPALQSAQVHSCAMLSSSMMKFNKLSWVFFALSILCRA